MIIEDGTGTGKRLKIDDENRLHARVITETEIKHANEQGDSYAIHTAKMDVTGSTDIALFYLKNNEQQTLIVDSMIIGFGTGSALNPVDIMVLRDPTAGSIITNAVEVGFAENRNFSSSKVLLADHYKGTLGDTFTDGDPIGEYFGSHNQRLVAVNTDWTLPQGTAIGINVNPNLSSGIMTMYIVLIAYLKSTVES